MWMAAGGFPTTITDPTAYYGLFYKLLANYAICGSPLLQNSRRHRTATKKFKSEWRQVETFQWCPLAFGTFQLFVVVPSLLVDKDSHTYHREAKVTVCTSGRKPQALNSQSSVVITTTNQLLLTLPTTRKLEAWVGLTCIPDRTWAAGPHRRRRLYLFHKIGRAHVWTPVTR